MLRKLSIDNYILIRKLEIEFSQGLSVITGETGSGKSILLGALNLILGQRADISSLLDKSRKCVVEGTFFLKGYELEQFFSGQDIDYDDQTILRREINQNGKSRAFINDTPVNLSVLKELGDRLVNIHSQHSVITLNDAEFQMAVLDNYAGQVQAVKSYRQAYKKYIDLNHRLEDLKVSEAKSKGELDYNRFLLEELTQARLREGEQEESEQRLEMINHTEEIKGSLFKAAENLGRAEINVLSLLNETVSSISAASKYHSPLEEILSRLQNDLIDLKDILKDTEGLEEAVHFDPEEAGMISQRLDLIYRLQKKHQVRTVKELIEIHKKLEDKIQDDNTLENSIKVLEEELLLKKKELETQAAEISEARVSVCADFEKQVLEKLVQLGMPAAGFRVAVDQKTMISPDGIDEVRFLFSANKGVALSEVSKVASGGELSRLMLTIKSMISQKNLLPTVIFDEIDNGVSGDVAGKVGNILRNMSETIQVLVITHLPQIAGKGDQHYNVFKSEEKDHTMTHIRKLKSGERVEEIARMMSNENVTAAALKTAKELLKN